MNSFVIRKLKTEEIVFLKSELLQNNDLWNHHVPQDKKSLTALKDGRSIHLRFDKMKGIDTDNWNRFPETVKLLETIADGNVINRTYWHRLLPSDTIEKHTDNSVYYVKENKILARYQIYLDIPDDSYMLLDNQIVEDASRFSNSIVNFDLRKYHAYENKSDSAWYFLIFDVMKD